MRVELLHSTPLWVCARAIRKCWASEGRSDAGGDKDKELIDRVGNKHKHASTLEHLVYTFEIEGIARAVLQELARHRLSSFSVKSTRYTLKELKEADSITSTVEASRYCVMTGAPLVDKATTMALAATQEALRAGVKNDQAKFSLPESYRTSLVWTINARALQNFLQLRMARSALWAIQDLALAIYDALPEDHKYLFKEQLPQE